MNSLIIKERTYPKVRFQIQGIYIGERLNRMIVKKKFNFIVNYYFMKIVFIVYALLTSEKFCIDI